MAVFSTFVCSALEKSRAKILIDSIRTFGGPLSESPILLFAVKPDEMPCYDLAGKGVDVIPLKAPEAISHYFFADKVCACARAEELAGAEETLICMDSVCLMVNSPILYNLDAGTDAAVRPVHIRNVGLLRDSPIDLYWQKVYESLGVQDISVTVESFVDQKLLRAYFNSHAFAVRPALGLMGRWREYFTRLVNDREYQQTACGDRIHQIFLFQAILSTLFATTLETPRLRILPWEYNYPYDLHASVSPDRQARSLNDLVSVVAEEKSLDSAKVHDIQIEEPLKSWLTQHWRE